MNTNKFHIIYKTINIVNRKIYVGKHSTNDIDDGYLGSGLHLKRSIGKHGKENFKREILELCTKETLDEREIFWIKELDSINLDVGYNITIGGTGGDTLSNNPNKIEIIKKFTKSINDNHSFVGENNPMFGVKLSDDVIKLRNESIKLAWSNKELRSSVSIKMSGENNPFFGKHHSEETRKILNKPKSEEHKANLSISQKNSPKLTCPYCLKTMGTSNCKKYHFEKCKLYEQQR